MSDVIVKFAKKLATKKTGINTEWVLINVCTNEYKRLIISMYLIIC